MRYVNQNFIRASTVEGRDLVIGKVSGLYIKSQGCVREANYCALSFRPLGDWQRPTWPVLDFLRVRVILILQPHQHQMTTVARWKARYFEVVANERVASGESAVLSLK